MKKRYRSLNELKQDLAGKGADIEIIGESLPASAGARSALDAAADRSQRDVLQGRFRALWASLGGQILLEEHRFHPVRRWRSDFACPAASILIEVEGGTRQQGRHNRHAGYRNDAIKYNAATLMGYRVFRFTSDMITAEHLQPVIDLVASLQNDTAPSADGVPSTKRKGRK
jgi:very-short-patch-repair endonuclease